MCRNRSSDGRDMIELIREWLVQENTTDVTSMSSVHVL